MSAPRTPLSTVDLIVQYEGKVVLIRRKHEPYQGCLALPGGFQECGESLEDAARRECKEETSLDVELENPGRAYTFSAPGRDPRGPVNSHLYFARGQGTLRYNDDALPGGLYGDNELIGMLNKGLFAFDHEHMIVTYLRWKGVLE